MPRGSNCQRTHSSREGGPCKICDATENRYWHIANALPNHALAVENLQQHFKVSEMDCICWNCHRKWNTTEQPIAKKPKVDSRSCLVPNCTNLHQIHQTDKGDECKLRQCFQLPEAHVKQVPQLDGKFFICHLHYNIYNRFLSPSENCSVCDHRTPGGSNRSCGNDVDKFKSYLIALNLYAEDMDLANMYLCLSCFASYHRYCKGESFIREQRCSKHFFQSLIDALQENVDRQSCIDVSIYKSVIHLGEVLLSDKAILLDKLYQHFSESCLLFDVSQCRNHELHKLTEKQMKKLLLKRIRASLGECVTSYSVPGNERLGIVFRRFGTDIQNCLLKSLYECNKENERLKRHVEEMERKLKGLETQGKCHLTAAADDLQSRVATQAKVFSDNKLPIDTFDFISLIRSVDPVVWNFLVRISLNKQEVKSFYNKMTFRWDTHYMSTHKSTTLSHSKQLKRLNLICCLLFLQNDQAYLPFHMLITDIVPTYNNSKSQQVVLVLCKDLAFTHSSGKCVSILSQFGICVSKDTLLRYQKHVAEQEMVNKQFLTNSFTVVSIDNIDKNSQYAAVRSSEHSRGFHGTSIQAVQSLPTACKTHLTNLSQVPQVTQSSMVQQVEIGRERRICPSTVSSYHSGSNQMFNPLNPQRGRCSNLNIEDFQLSNDESAALSTQEHFLFQYILTKTSAKLTKPELSLPGLKAAHHSVGFPNTEKSEIQFVAVLPKPADSKETMKHSLSMLYTKYDIGNSRDQLVVVGDGKTYDILMNLKREYGTDLDWMLPYIGDWHLLKNCQGPIMKVYLDAGLKDLLLKGGYRGAKLTSVANATVFDTTHHFLLQVWEAFYQFQVKAFFDSTELRDEITSNINDCISASLNSEHFPYMDTSSMLSAHPVYKERFEKFCSELCLKNATFRFWHHFVHRDMFHYINLYLAIRSRNFDLRNACVLQLTPLFHALDRHMHLKIIPFHIADLKKYPAHILECFSQGAFTVGITGDNWSCVALDEAHEMVINKNVKMALTTTGTEGLSKLVHYLPHRTRSVCNLSLQMSRKIGYSSPQFLSPSLIKYEEENILVFFTELQSAAILDTGPSDLLYHLFTEQVAAPKASTDLLNFFEYGQQDFNSYLKCIVLNVPGAKRPQRKRRNITTFTTPKKTVAKPRKEIQDQKLQISCLRKQVAWSKSQNQAVSDFHQVLSLPRALCSADGIPYKASKAVSSTFFNSRYPNAFTDIYTPTKEATAYKAEGMFLINTTPLQSHETFRDYMSFLFRQWVLRPFREYHASEVHVVFDHPSKHGLSPKDVERTRRDSKQDSTADTQFSSIDVDDKLPRKWRAFLGVRSQKRLLVNLISSFFVSLASQKLHDGQTFITSGGFDGQDTDKAFCARPNETNLVSEYTSSHEEGDSRVWLHFAKTSCKSVVIYSPDRDTFHVGLPVVKKADKKAVVQLRASRGDNLYLCVNSLLSSLSDDLSLQALGDAVSDVPEYLQVLFICSGCDYVSFFKGHSKKKFMEVFFRHCRFVTGGVYSGYLNQVGSGVQELGLLAFYRLVGCVYFQQHMSAFSVDTAEELFDNVSTSTSDLSDLDIHVKFLTVIRESIFHRITSEDQWMPTVDALKYHWLRTCWIALVWSQASTNLVVIPDCIKYGWSQTDQGKITVIWDSEENKLKVSESVRYLKNGCKCKTGCITGRCACHKRKKHCGPGCSCLRCKNTQDFEDENLTSSDSDTESTCSTSSDGSAISSHDGMDEDADDTFQFLIT
ncbi:uncharacterized protein [Antedon mediterranea]|uniref:uncharacterized protein n=1 Tax=Antedon mediterranea TaxID=105859 RepID=UPI003AF8D280